MKKILFVVIVNLVLVTLLLYGVEFLFSPYRDSPKNGRINGDRYTWGHLVENNKHGFRERDFKSPKPLGIYRVLVLGDSLTWGVGLGVEERYTAIAEKLLNKTVSDRNIEILNFGISGSPTTVERDLLENIKRGVDPDLIVVGFCLNDPQQKSQDYSIERESLRKTTIVHIFDSVFQSMRDIGLVYISKLFENAFYRLTDIPTWQNALQRTYEPSSREWLEFVQALTDIKSISDKSNLSSPIFAILNQGTYTDKPTDYSDPDKNLKQFLKWYHQAEKAAENIGFIAYNHEHEIAHQLKNESLAVNIIDGHPSANLNRIYGEKLYLIILEQITQHQWKL